MARPNQPHILGNLRDHPDLAAKQERLEAELERRHPGSVKRLKDGAKMVCYSRGQDPDLDEGFEGVLAELARRSGVVRPSRATVKVREGDSVTVDGYHLRVSMVCDSGVVYLELRDGEGRLAASCPADGDRLVPDAAGTPPPPPKPIPSSAIGRRELLRALVEKLGA